MLVAAGLFGLAAQPLHAEPPTPAAALAIETGETVTAMASFLDRLMMAESGGRDGLKNPRSTALGPFQFIDQTFLELTRRHFAVETAGLAPQTVLALRTDRAFSRRVAEAFTRDNAAYLVGNGLDANWANLRLAFFAGPAGAVRVLQAEPAARVETLLGAAAVRANPFLATMTAAGLIAWSGRTLDMRTGTAAALAARASGLAQARATPRGSALKAAPRIVAADAAHPPPRTAIRPPCNLGLASCRQWLALAERRASRPSRPPSRVAGRR